MSFPSYFMPLSWWWEVKKVIAISQGHPTRGGYQINAGKFILIYFFSKLFKLGNRVLRAAEHSPRERLPEGKLGHLNGILNWNIYSVSSLPVPYTRWKCFKSSPWFIAKCTPWFSVSEHSQDSECWLRDIFISQWSHEEILSSCNRYPFPKQRHQTEVMLFLCEIPAQLSHFKEYPNQSFFIETKALICGIHSLETFLSFPEVFDVIWCDISCLAWSLKSPVMSVSAWAEISVSSLVLSADCWGAVPWHLQAFLH